MNANSRKNSKVFASFEEFDSALDQAIESSRQRRRHASLISILKRKAGFSLSDEQTKNTLEKIRQLPDFDVIEFTILIESRLNPRPRPLIARLGTEVLSKYIRDTNFSEYMQDEPSFPSICAWIERLRSGNATRGNQGRAINDQTLRAAFGCLLVFLEKDLFLQSVLHLLKLYIGNAHLQRIKKFEHKPRQGFAAVVGDLVRPSKPKMPQIKLLIAATRQLQNQLQLLTEARRRQADELAALELTHRESAEELAVKKREIVQHEEKLSHLGGQIRQLEAQLREEAARTAATEQHWKEVLQQEVTGLSFRLRSQLEHEVEGIQLCLQGGNPNTEMALHRLKRISEIIAEMGRTQ